MFKNNLYNKRKFLKILGLASIGVGSFSAYNFLGKDLKQVKWTGEVLNNPVQLEIHSNDEAKNRLILSEIDKKIIEFDNIFNLQNPKSEISRLNEHKYLDNPSRHLVDVLKKSIMVSEKTNGLFDPTVQPLWEMYYKHFIIDGYSNPPSEDLIKQTTKLVNYNNINVDKKQISLINKSSITLNGIAQGWITDNITSIIKTNGIKNTLVDFGEMYALGKHNNSRAWNILVDNNDVSKLINLSNKAIATSAGSGTSFEPTHSYHHIFNPKSGISPNRFKAVSILSDKAWLSDALSTAAISMNKFSLEKICKEFGTEAYILEDSTFKKLV